MDEMDISGKKAENSPKKGDDDDDLLALMDGA